MVSGKSPYGKAPIPTTTGMDESFGMIAPNASIVVRCPPSTVRRDRLADFSVKKAHAGWLFGNGRTLGQTIDE